MQAAPAKNKKKSKNAKAVPVSSLEPRVLDFVTKIFDPIVNLNSLN